MGQNVLEGEGLWCLPALSLTSTGPPCAPLSKGKPTPDESGRRGGFVYKASQTQGRQGQIKSFRDTRTEKIIVPFHSVCCKIKTSLNYKINKKKSNKVLIFLP